MCNRICNREGYWMNIFIYYIQRMIFFESSVRYVWDDLNNIKIWMIKKNVWSLINEFQILSLQF